MPTQGIIRIVAEFLKSAHLLNSIHKDYIIVKIAGFSIWSQLSPPNPSRKLATPLCPAQASLSGSPQEDSSYTCPECIAYYRCGLALVDAGLS